MYRESGTIGKALVAVIASAALALCISMPAVAQYRVLHSFGSGTDGGGLWNSVTLDKKGHIYGATSGGGLYNGGTVFRLTPQPDGKWGEKILHSFFESNDDAAGPNGGLVQDKRGHWYGTSQYGGNLHYGTVFELTHAPSGWKERVLYSFGTQSEGGEPTAGLVMDESGNLYGTASAGGEPDHNDGTVFKLTPGPTGWSETILYTFCLAHDGCTDGVRPFAGVIRDAAGNLYGTTQYGGRGCPGDGCGTVYKLKPQPDGSWKETVLHRFNNDGKDGVTPGWGSLFRDSTGRLYGTTFGGGTAGGIIYRLTHQPDGHWKESILYNFKKDASGYSPNTGVIMDSAGNLYGTTDYGGAGDCGVIYKLAPGKKGQWKYTVLHTFTGSDGCLPEGNLVPDKNGNYYGVTALGGDYGAGVVFEFTP